MKRNLLLLFLPAVLLASCSPSSSSSTSTSGKSEEEKRAEKALQLKTVSDHIFAIANAGHKSSSIKLGACSIDTDIKTDTLTDNYFKNAGKMLYFSSLLLANKSFDGDSIMIQFGCGYSYSSKPDEYIGYRLNVNVDAPANRITFIGCKTISDDEGETYNYSSETAEPMHYDITYDFELNRLMSLHFTTGSIKEDKKDEFEYTTSIEYRGGFFYKADPVVDYNNEELKFNNYFATYKNYVANKHVAKEEEISKWGNDFVNAQKYYDNSLSENSGIIGIIENNN